MRILTSSARGEAPGRGIDHQLDLLVLEEVHGVGPALLQLEDALHLQSGLLQDRRRPARRNQIESQVDEFFGHCGHLRLVRIADADENASGGWQRRLAAIWDLA